ncbi:MAG: hypothetical protein RMJ28_01020 [Nitrososphaerota archaeon]|nr:hypothetical protein [Candidatus Calditenuaceae archaeon]MDW8072813.1 hypothetical protein [Nitrososphaerota archaeon]
MRRLDILVKPPLKRSAIEAIKIIDEGGYEAVFLNLPRCLQPYIDGLTELGDLDDFMKTAQERPNLNESYLAALLRGHEDFLRLLPRVALTKDIICYVPNPTGEEIQTYLELPSLILRDSLTGAVSTSRWIEIVEKMRLSSNRKAEMEAEFLARETMCYGAAVCLTEPEAAVGLKRLLQTRVHTKIIYTALPYAFTPLQTLLRTIRNRPPTISEIEQHAKKHIHFVKNYIIPFGLEEGLEKWTETQLRWLMGPPGQKK